MGEPMKKIMQINITCGNGSTGKLALALYNESVAAGFAGAFAYAEFEPKIDTAFRIETKPQNVLRRLQNRLLGRKQKHSAPGTKQLIRYIEREKPDLIHLHNIHHNILQYPVFFKYLKEKGIPFVFTLHDCWGFTGWCYHFVSRNCEEYKTGCGNCTRGGARDDVGTPPHAAWQCKKDLLGGNDNAYPVCVSNWLRDCAAASYMGQMKHPPITIYNGIDTQLFSPQKESARAAFGIPEDAFVILSVASFWTEGKGLSMLLELSEKLPPKTVLVLGGQDLEQVKKPNVICFNRTESQEQLASLYSTADVFINASIEETFGLTTAEAMACGTPAIVFNSTACPEIVDEHTGIVAEHTAEGLLEAVLQIREKGKDAYRDACVKRVKEHFDEKRMVKEYLALYRSILDER